MVQKFPALYVARSFITVFTNGRAAGTYLKADERSPHFVPRSSK